MKKSFSLIELIIVIIVVGILYSSINFSLANSSLNQAADQIISHINYTRHLAIKDNKMQYYPINNSKIEMNRSKYWFKQWWHLRFSDYNKSGVKYYYYEIFTDVPDDSESDNFDQNGKNPTDKWNDTFAKNPVNHKYLVGNCYSSGYPDCDKIDETLNLTKSYSIKKIIFNNFNVANRAHILFDNYGVIYLDEGKSGDKGDINPYDKDERVPLLKTAKITLCVDDNCEENISVCISPKIGNAYICK